MDTNPGLIVRLLRGIVLMLLAAVCYQFGYASGSVSGDWQQLKDRIAKERINDGATAINDAADDVESAG